MSQPALSQVEGKLEEMKLRTVGRMVDVADLGKLRQGVNWATPYRLSTGITGKPVGKIGKNSEKEECPIFSPCGEYPQRDTISLSFWHQEGRFSLECGLL